MKMHIKYFCVIAVTALSTNIALASDVVKAPSGWTDEQRGNSRVVSNGNASVSIGPWTFLEGLTLNEVITRAASVNPDGGVITLIKKIKPESSVPGALSVIRKVNFSSQN